MEPYDGVIEVACPYANCGAGEGMECIVHHNDGRRTVRDSPHVVRVRAAKDAGIVEADPDGIVSELRAEIEATS